MSDARISIVVTAFADEAGLADTLDSLDAQDHRDLQVIVQRAASGPTGLGDALNRGFIGASGEIFGWLHAGEMLLRGALGSVANEIAPERGRHVVLGRTWLIVEGADFPAVEHPSEYLGHFEHLAAWKRPFDAVPTASLFWHRGAAARAGPFPAADREELAYDLVCRLGRHDVVHAVAAPWSASRLAAATRPEAELREMRIRASRRHWGPWLAPLRWRCAASFALHRLHLHDRARHHARWAEQAMVEGRALRAALERLRTWLTSPAMARGRFGGTRRGTADR